MLARRWAFFLFATVFLGLALPCLAAAAIPRAYGLERLADNGRVFMTSEGNLPLRCLDAPGLLGLPVDEQNEILNKAAAAGFNSISFEAPLFGNQGLAKTLGKIDSTQVEALRQILHAIAKRKLYAFPVLWTPTAADALIGTSNAKAVFWGGKNSLGWQAWLTHELTKLKVDGRPITQTAAVGAWLIYRGPWPGGTPKQGEALEQATPSTEAWMRNWIQWQGKLMRKAGFAQRLGFGLWAKQDFPLSVEPKAEAPSAAGGVEKSLSPAIEAAPFAPFSEDLKVSADTSLAHAKELDALPQVPRRDSNNKDRDTDDGSHPVTAPAMTPWDLEGLDWDRVESFIATAPMSTQIDFFEFTLETEDWYRVGDRLADAVTKAEVPVLWRQDWRTASRYERAKRLDAPVPVAGLVGPWPDDDWPGEGESIWPPQDKDASRVPFKFRTVALKRKGRQILLTVELNKPGTLIVRWGKAWPLNQEVRSKGRSKAEYNLPLVGALPGQWLLLQVKADSQKSGGAVARTRWVRAPK